MKLFTNGCSFTHGHNLYKDLAPTWTWPFKMSVEFDEVVNYAWFGGSNTRIVRTTLDYFNKVDVGNEWIAVIQWTDPHSRTELYDEETDTFIGFCLGAPSAILGLPDHKKFVDFPPQFDIMIDRYKNYGLLFNTTKQNEINLIHQQLLLADFLRSKNIKFLYTSMSYSGFIPHDHNYPLAKLLPRSNIIDPISKHVSLLQPDLIESLTDLHPNKDGHQVIANYITQELQARQYI